MKKVKLFTTIASLCLAVALMAFGVYAATTSMNLGVSGNIQFNATGLDGTWTYDITPGDGCAALADELPEIENAAASEIQLAFVAGANEAKFTVEATFTPTSEVAKGKLSVAGVDSTFGSASKSTVKYTNATEDTWAVAGDAVTVSILVTVTVDAGDQNGNLNPAWAVTFTAETTPNA